MSLERCIHLSKTISQASRMLALGCSMRLRSVRILFWNATRPVKRKAREEISPKISPFRRIVIDVLALGEADPMTLHSSRNVPMHEVTIWQTSMSAEQSDTRSSVSRLVDAAALSG